MNGAIQLLAAALISVTLSLIVLRALSGPLADVLGRVCPDDQAAAFWLRYVQLMLAIAPLLVALAVDMLGGAQAPLEALRLMLIASLVGLLVGLAAIGRRLGQFITFPKEGPKA